MPIRYLSSIRIFVLQKLVLASGSNGISKNAD